MTTTLAPRPVSIPAEKTTLSDIVVPFSRIRRKDVPTVGGKGANLGEMTAAGLPVPPGFVLSIDAYRRFYESNELGPRVAAELMRIDPDDPAALERTAASLREMILSGSVPDNLQAEIEKAYASLSQDQTPFRRVAVRSSATAEDTAQYSFAGMFESFLNVVGQAALIDAVKGCWASTFSARVLFYRVKQGLPVEMPVAVIVQRMVNSEKSGVMFTSDPATRDSSRIVIEAAWGLGESVVQGSVTPDRHVIDKQTLAIISTNISEKEFLLTWDARKQKTISVSLEGDPRAKAPVLTPGELETLGSLARRAEQHYAAPQDLEFAIEGSEIYLTQSRPITTLQPAPTTSRSPSNTSSWSERGLSAKPSHCVRV